MAVDVITVPLTWIINNSLENGIFPTCWKISKCIPLFKNKGKRSDKTKYRPVSLLKAVSKVIEKIVNKQVLNYMETNPTVSKVTAWFSCKEKYLHSCRLHA